MGYCSLTLGKNDNRELFSPDGTEVLVLGDRDKSFLVNGSGLASGYVVKIYWDCVQEWDPHTGRGFIQETVGTPQGTFQTTIRIPDSTNGLHYVWVVQEETSNFVRSNALWTIIYRL